MRILQLAKFIRIHWLLLGLLVVGAISLLKPENVATAQATDQSFSKPTAWVNELTMSQGWGPEYPRMLADMNGDGRQDIIGFGIHGTWRSLAPPSHNIAFVIEDFGYNQAWRVVGARLWWRRFRFAAVGAG